MTESIGWHCGVLKIYGVGGKLLSAIKSFYEEASACVKINEVHDTYCGLVEMCLKFYEANHFC